MSSPDEHRQAGAQQFPTIECAVITVSDSRTELTDKSGALIQSMLQEAGHEVVGYRLVKNDAQQITQALTHMLAGRARFVMLTGGTGPGTRDITVETVQSLLEKELTGFGELFRILSYEEIGAATILSRATAGRIGNKFVVCCPGSSGAVRLALNEILIPELAHILREMNR
jgi:molybdenum cofactor biosynthesis protein B